MIYVEVNFVLALTVYVVKHANGLQLICEFPLGNERRGVGGRERNDLPERARSTPTTATTTRVTFDVSDISETKTTLFVTLISH